MLRRRAGRSGDVAWDGWVARVRGDGGGVLARALDGVEGAGFVAPLPYDEERDGWWHAALIVLKRPVRELCKRRDDDIVKDELRNAGVLLWED